MMILHYFRSLTTPQRPTRLLLPHQPTLRFWCLMPKGERDRVWLDLGGAIYLGGAYLLYLAFYVWYITMHSCLLSCIELHTCDCDIYVICVILMWYVTCVLSTLIYIYVMSLHYAHLLCFHVLLRFKWALFLVLMLISYLLSTTCWLGSYKHA